MNKRELRHRVRLALAAAKKGERRPVMVRGWQDDLRPHVTVDGEPMTERAAEAAKAKK